MASLADILKENHMELCKCNRGGRAVYYCKEDECPNKGNNPTYCLLCYKDKKMHIHMTCDVAEEIDD
jgi:hypothetical protein